MSGSLSDRMAGGRGASGGRTSAGTIVEAQEFCAFCWMGLEWYPRASLLVEGSQGQFC